MRKVHRLLLAGAGATGVVFVIILQNISDVSVTVPEKIAKQ